MTDQLFRWNAGKVLLADVSKNDRIIKFRLSDDGIDRMNSRIDPRGILTENYEKNPVFLWGHDGYGGGFRGPPKMEHVIGKTVKWDVTRVSKGRDDRGFAFDIEVEFATTDINPYAQMAFMLVSKGFLSSTSIGVAPLDWKMEKVAEGLPDVTVYTKCDMLEGSLVPVPANPNAVRLAHSLGYDYEFRDMLPGDQAEALTRWLHGQGRSAPTPPANAADPGTTDLVDSILNHARARDQAALTVDLIKRAIGDRMERSFR